MIECALAETSSMYGSCSLLHVHRVRALYTEKILIGFFVISQYQHKFVSDIYQITMSVKLKGHFFTLK